MWFTPWKLHFCICGLNKNNLYNLVCVGLSYVTGSFPPSSLLKQRTYLSSKTLLISGGKSKSNRYPSTFFSSYIFLNSQDVFFLLFFPPPLSRYPLSFNSTSLPLLSHLILLLTSHVNNLNYNASYRFFFLINPSFYLCLDAFPPCWVSLLLLSPSLPCSTLGLFLAESELFFFIESVSQS